MQTLWQGHADLNQQQQDSSWPLAVSFQLLSAPPHPASVKNFHDQTGHGPLRRMAAVEAAGSHPMSKPLAFRSRD